MKQTDKAVSKDNKLSIPLRESGDEATCQIDDNDTTERESGGYENGPEPTRYGDWEIAGRCIDF